MVYRDFADDAARDLANGINQRIGLTMRLEAWKEVIEGLDVGDRNLLLHEPVQNIAATSLISPNTLKARFYFAVAHLSHQANCIGKFSERTGLIALEPKGDGLQFCRC